MTEQAMQSEPMETSNVVSQEPVSTTDTTFESNSIPESNEPVEAVATSEGAGSATEEVTSNAENAKKRIDKKSKKMQRRIDELEAWKSQQEAAMYAPQQPQEQFNPAVAQPQQVVDPFTGEHLSPGTQRYETVLYDQQKQVFQEKRVAQQQQQETDHYQQQQDEQFFDALDDASERYDDFDEVVRNDGLPLSESMLGVAKVTPNSADFLYYLAKNPKEVQRISKLHPVVQQKEMARHAIQFASRNQVSKAPAPVQPVGDTSGNGTPSSFSKLSQNPKAFRKYLRDKQRRIRK